MTSLGAALREHAPQYLRKLEQTKANLPILKALSAIMSCRTGALGGVQWHCDGCGRVHWTGRSCGNRHCATCGSDKAQAWLQKQSGKLLIGVHHFLVTFTVPEELRELLRVHRRDGYEALLNASSAALIDVAASTKALRGCRLGFFGVLHTWGRDPMVYHPHVHYLVPGGGVTYDDQGEPEAWKQTPTNFLVHHGTLIRVFKAKLADELRSCGLYQATEARTWRKDFVVDIEPVDDGRAAVAYLAPYIHRVAISDHRIQSVDAQSVTYQYVPSKTCTAKTRTVDGQTFVQGFAQHILPTGFRKVRYHGWMCSSSKTRLETIRILVWFSLGWIYWLASGHAPRTPLNKIPTFACDQCHGIMRVRKIVFHHISPEYLNRPHPSHPLPAIDSS